MGHVSATHYFRHTHCVDICKFVSPLPGSDLCSLRCIVYIFIEYSHFVFISQLSSEPERGLPGCKKLQAWLNTTMKIKMTDGRVLIGNGTAMTLHFLVGLFLVSPWENICCLHDRSALNASDRKVDLSQTSKAKVLPTRPLSHSLSFYPSLPPSLPLPLFFPLSLPCQLGVRESDSVLS